MRKKLGEILLESKVITLDQLDEALTKQKTSKAKIGEILVAFGYASPRDIHMALAKQEDIDFEAMFENGEIKEKYEVRLIGTEQQTRDSFIKNEFVAVNHADGVKIFTADGSPQKLNLIKNLLGNQKIFKIAVTSINDVVWSVQSMFKKLDIENSTNGIKKNMPSSSARKITENIFFKFTLLFFLFSFVYFLFDEEISLYLILSINFIYFLSLAAKALFCVGGARKGEEGDYIQFFDDEIPVYSVLVPMYKENEVTIIRLIAAMRNLDYPKEKLDIKLIVEEDDQGTIDIIKSLKPEYYFQIIKVPASKPRTKPKAMNYALSFCKGEYVVIYDAEDQPDPFQLKKVLSIFQQSDSLTACVQCKLNFYNYKENWLTKFFAIEYFSWFSFMLFGLHRLGLAIPLGGTSNHFKTNVLKGLYAWDAFNVTEDAELGVRMKLVGLETKVCESTTYEEAPIHLKQWLMQRARWIKGHIVTFLVHATNFKGSKHGSIKAFAGFTLFLGMPPLIFGTMPIMFLFSILYKINGWIFLPVWALDLCYYNLWLAVIFHVLLGLYCVKKMNQPELKLAAILLPLYWILHCIAFFIAIYELVVKTHHWNKTAHGISTMLK